MWAYLRHKLGITALMAKLDDELDALNTALAGIGTNVASMQPEITKISGETSSLLQIITDLKNNPPTGITADQQAKLDAALASATSIQTSTQTLATAVQAVDDLVPDPAPPAGGSGSGSTTG